MRIEHAAMYVRDLEKEKQFFEDFFSAKAGEKYVHAEVGFSSYFLIFPEGARLELMHSTQMTDAEKSLDASEQYQSKVILSVAENT